MARASEDPPSPVDAYEAGGGAANDTGAPPPPPPPPPNRGYYFPPAAAYSSYGYANRAGDTNMLALIGLIASCIGFTLPGIVMGFIALAQIRRTGESGRGFALAAIIVGFSVLALIFILVIVYIVFIFTVVSTAGNAVTDFGGIG